MDWKNLAKTAAVSLACIALYHAGTLDFVPVFKGAKKS